MIEESKPKSLTDNETVSKFVDKYFDTDGELGQVAQALQRLLYSECPVRPGDRVRLLNNQFYPDCTVYSIHLASSENSRKSHIILDTGIFRMHVKVYLHEYGTVWLPYDEYNTRLQTMHQCKNISELVSKYYQTSKVCIMRRDDDGSFTQLFCGHSLTMPPDVGNMQIKCVVDLGYDPKDTIAAYILVKSNDEGEGGDNQCM